MAKLLGHACLSFSPDADPPAVDAEVRSACREKPTVSPSFAETLAASAGKRLPSAAARIGERARQDPNL